MISSTFVYCLGELRSEMATGGVIKEGWLLLRGKCVRGTCLSWELELVSH